MNFKLLFLLFFYHFMIMTLRKIINSDYVDGVVLCRWWGEWNFQTSHTFLPNGNDDNVDDLFNSLSSMRESALLSK